MKTRILSGLILAPLLVIVYLGGWPLLIGCVIIASVSIKEFFNGFRNIDIKPSFAIGYLSILLLYSAVIAKMAETSYMAWFFICVTLCLLYLFNIKERTLQDAMATITGIVYVVFFSFHVVLIDRISGYESMIWLVFIAAFGTDTMAYFSGYLFGKNKLCPNISPKKTIEGAIGGMLGSVLLCGVFGYIVVPNLLLHCLLIGIFGSIAAQIGDLSASIFKRKMGIKDYGNLIPGHGGMMDRFDSILFTAPLVYYYIMMVIA